MKRFMVLVSAMMVLGGSVATAKVIGRVNGYPITERAANAFLKVVTKGKLKYHQLRPKDKKDVIKRLAADALLIGLSKKELSTMERNQVVVNYWLTKKVGKVTVTDAEVKKAYESNKKMFKDPKGKILPFEQVKGVVAVSLKQKKYVERLMEKARITMGKKVIKAPKNSSKHSSSKKSASHASSGKTKIYVVKSGNTLSGIAHKYHITMDQLRTMNNMSKKDVLKVGQKLKVPEK